MSTAENDYGDRGTAHESRPLGALTDQSWSGEAGQEGALPVRRGVRPATQSATGQSQLDQSGVPVYAQRLLDGIAKLDGVHVGPSGISGPASQAGLLSAETARGPAEAFIVGSEFGHVHSDGSGSLHVVLPTDRATQAIEAGWGEWHPTVTAGDRPPNLVFLYGARTDADLDVLWGLVQDSYRFARGADTAQPNAVCR